MSKNETKLRPLSEEEKAALRENGNSSPDNFAGVLTASEEGDFDASFIKNNVLSSRIVFPVFTRTVLSYHDLKLEAGVYNSRFQDVEIEGNCAVHNVAYMENFTVEEEVILFNIQEMITRKNAKFGESVLNEGESESERICLEVINENGGRKILAFSDITAADAYIMSKYRDEEIQTRFREMTDRGRHSFFPRRGRVARGAVIKNTLSVKDANVGEYTYIKGALKIKNITILSSEKERSQIGEAVVLVNGIMQEGSKAFYSAIGVRFVLGENSCIKYGARLINSVLADNSTVSCCEILNNLIYPFHEQHHNSSFLIASLVQGQSNIASGATIASNHNSRSPDGEMKASRGFWPGLNVSLKHNSLFSSFVMIEKGSYKHEMKILYPFSLVSDKGEEGITVLPAWLLYANSFFVLRNGYKFAARDKRMVKRQFIHTSPFECDTAQEVMSALFRLSSLSKAEGEKKGETEDKEAYRHGRCVILNIEKAKESYRGFLYYFAECALKKWAKKRGKEKLSGEDISILREEKLYTQYVNAGGKITGKERLETLVDEIRSGEKKEWSEVHEEYEKTAKLYTRDAARYALHILEVLEGKNSEAFAQADYEEAHKKAVSFKASLYEGALSRRKEDYTDCYRTMVYDEDGERDAVLGRYEEDSFIRTLQAEFISSKSEEGAVKL